MKLAVCQPLCLWPREGEDPEFLQLGRRFLLAPFSLGKEKQILWDLCARGGHRVMAQALGQPGQGLSSSTPASIIPGAWGWELSLGLATELLCVCREHRDHTGGAHPKVLQGAEPGQSCGIVSPTRRSEEQDCSDTGDIYPTGTATSAQPASPVRMPL